MTTSRLSIEDIKRAANDRPEDLLSALGINEKLRPGSYISMCSPVRRDRRPSFTIWIKNGFLAWRDEATGDKGDVLGLVAHVKCWEHLPKKGIHEVCRFVSSLYGLETISADQLAHDRMNSRRRTAEIQKKAGEEKARNEGRAMELWLRASTMRGTATETYLRDRRGIDLASLPKGPRGGIRTPNIIRHIDWHEHLESNRRFPCMIAGCVDHRLEVPQIRAVHRTWLKPDGSGKADVTPQRKVWPGFTGLVIPIWKGASNLTIGEAIKHGVRETLVLTEGVEDGLTAAIADPTHRVWAMISLGNMGNVPIPECIDGIILHRQNDWDKRQAIEQFERGKAALEAHGVPVVEVAATGGKDLNDTLRGED